MITDCWLAHYRPAGTAKGNHCYVQLRSRTPFANGKTTQHIPEAQVPAYEKLVANGRRWKKLTRLLDRWQRQAQTPREALTSSASDEWYTPPFYVELAREVMGGIDLDPASNVTAQRWIQATRYFTIAENGLECLWDGRVWLNPPYGPHTASWTRKAISSHDNGHIGQAILLVRPAVGTSWYQELAAQFPRAEPHKRIKFIDETGSPQSSPVHGNAFFYLGPNHSRFCEIFSSIGTVSIPFQLA